MSRWELLELAKQTMEGKFGNGEKRRALLGGRYEAVQGVVDYILRLEDERHRKAEEMEDRVRMCIYGKEKNEKHTRN